MKIFLICPVRNATDEQKQVMQDHITGLEKAGITVYYPARDTNQSDPTGYQICSDNLKGIIDADEVHIFYDPKSTGSLFDLGMTFALKKPLRIVNEIEPTEGKSFSNMILDWEKRG